MRNRMYGGVRGRKTKVGRKLLRFPPTRLIEMLLVSFYFLLYTIICFSFRYNKYAGIPMP